VKIRNFTATDGIVKAYAAYLPAPNAPCVHAYLGGLRQAKFYLPRKIEFCFIVTNNGKVWSYALRPYHVVRRNDYGQEVLTYVPTGGYVSNELHMVKGVTSRANLEGGYREPVAWALKDLARRAKLPNDSPDALRLDVAYEREAPAETGYTLPGPCGPIRYTGFSQKVGAYELREIHDTVCDAITAHLGKWAWRTSPPTPWKPSNLEIMLHSGNKAMGLAFAPGTGRVANKRTISLNDRLLKQYDLKSTWRVIIHELCHHYRDEAFAGNDADQATSDMLRLAVVSHVSKAQASGGYKAARSVQLQAMQTLRTHDAVFVRELAKVDPAVAADAYAGIVFNEYADPSLVAQQTAKKEARLAKVSWHPNDGQLWIDRLKDGSGVIYWVPLTGGTKVKIAALSDVGVHRTIAKLGLATGLQGNDMAQVVLRTPVTYSDRWPGDMSWRPTNFLDLIGFLENRLRIPIFAKGTSP
jgi:hypothetical protein